MRNILQLRQLQNVFYGVFMAELSLLSPQKPVISREISLMAAVAAEMSETMQLMLLMLLRQGGFAALGQCL